MRTRTTQSKTTQFRSVELHSIVLPPGGVDKVTGEYHGHMIKVISKLFQLIILLFIYFQNKIFRIHIT